MNLGKNDGKVRDLLTAAQGQGFRIEHSSKSFKVFPADKKAAIITIAATPSDRNFFWELRRMLKRSGFVEA